MREKNFKPKEYLEGKITEEKCSHSILIFNGPIEEMFDSNYKCLICGKTIQVNGLTYLNTENRYIILNYDHYLSRHKEELCIEMIKFISTIYIDEKNIDIVAIFTEIEPHIQEIQYVLNKTLSKK